MTLPDSNWTAAVIVGVVVGVLNWWQKRQLAVKVKTHGEKIESHDLQLSRLAKHEPHERHCSSVAQINKALETQDRLHAHKKDRR